MRFALYCSFNYISSGNNIFSDNFSLYTDLIEVKSKLGGEL